MGELSFLHAGHSNPNFDFSFLVCYWQIWMHTVYSRLLLLIVLGKKTNSLTCAAQMHINLNS